MTQPGTCRGQPGPPPRWPHTAAELEQTSLCVASRQGGERRRPRAASGTRRPGRRGRKKRWRRRLCSWERRWRRGRNEHRPARTASQRGRPLREDEDGAQLSGDGAARRGLGEDGNGMAVARNSPHRRRRRRRCRFPSIEPIHGRLRGIW